MAKKYSGEISLITENRRITLRLENGDTQELEDYFNLPILKILLSKFNDRPPHSDELLVVYAAMTGRDINEGAELVEACKEMKDEAGVASTLVCVKKCLWASVVAKAEDIPEQSLEQSLDQNLGKLQAVQTPLDLLSRTAKCKSKSWTQRILLKM